MSNRHGITKIATELADIIAAKSDQEVSISTVRTQLQSLVDNYSNEVLSSENMPYLECSDLLVLAYNEFNSGKPNSKAKAVKTFLNLMKDPTTPILISAIEHWNEEAIDSLVADSLDGDDDPEYELDDTEDGDDIADGDVDNSDEFEDQQEENSSLEGDALEDNFKDDDFDREDNTEIDDDGDEPEDDEWEDNRTDAEKRADNVALKQSKIALRPDNYVDPGKIAASKDDSVEAGVEVARKILANKKSLYGNK